MRTRFATKRGRPPLKSSAIATERDCGTQELILKRALNVTKEPIDLLLEYDLISEFEHRAALHFRWLYSLRYGFQRITSASFDEGSTSLRREDENEAWRRAREDEFCSIATRLKRAKRYTLLCDILIHHHWPLALRYEHYKRHGQQQSLRSTRLGENSITMLKEAIRIVRKKHPA